MSRLTDLIDRVEQKDPALAKELAIQVRALLERREFGLNFERHAPETIRLPGRRLRRGDQAMFLPRRRQTSGSNMAADEVSDTRSSRWLVTGLSEVSGKQVAKLLEIDAAGDAERRTALVDDLVVVASFRDPVYPGLRPRGSVERGGDTPFHCVINGENFYALEALRFPLSHKVDAIYIDPPYNSGDKDWKYNNDYVDSSDTYKHSKWLAFMERRLKLAKELLNPRDSVLVVTIDEKEYLRLGLLLGQVFPEARIQMVSIAINTAGVSRPGMFSRSDEYAFFVMFGSAAPQRLSLGPEWLTKKGVTFQGKIRWDRLIRSGPGSARTSGGFYPIYVDPDGPKVHLVGDALAHGISQAPTIQGMIAVLPIRADGSEGRWQCTPGVLRSRLAQGRVRLGGDSQKGYVAYYLKNGEYKKVEDGVYAVTGSRSDGSLITDEVEVGGATVPFTQWRLESHDASHHGTRLLQKMIPGRSFSFPKALYAVEDCLRFFVSGKPEAIVLDFFAGSGTTCHAVMRLNQEDGGRRRAIIVTNNEVSAEEEAILTAAGLRAGDPGWEALGVCEYVTKPRVTAAVTGLTPEGNIIEGEYLTTQEQALLADGFQQNVAFFDLSYEDATEIRLGMAFSALAPLLWMMAGSRGSRINAETADYALADYYAILFDIDATALFLSEIKKASAIRYVFVVADDDAQYQLVIAELPDTVKAVQLYEDYVRSLENLIGKG